jgi:hypothetical protein
VVRGRLIVAFLLMLPACRENRPTADRAEAPPADSALLNPMKADSMLDTMPGGEMARGNDSAARRLIKKKM